MQESNTFQADYYFEELVEGLYNNLTNLQFYKVVQTVVCLYSMKSLDRCARGIFPCQFFLNRNITIYLFYH